MEEGRDQRLRQFRTAACRWLLVVVYSSVAGCESKQTTSWQNGNAARDYPMHVVMTVTGGFTGVGGRWEADAKSSNSAVAGASKFDELARLVQQARAQGALGRDFSQAKGAMPQPFPDAQTYDIEVDGEHVRWSEPPPNGAAAAPPVLESMKTWLMDNAERQPNTRR